jgi:Ran GTPase-activating protein (RanGAP) involved in mRNA processing and transport
MESSGRWGVLGTGFQFQPNISVTSGLLARLPTGGSDKIQLKWTAESPIMKLCCGMYPLSYDEVYEVKDLVDSNPFIQSLYFQLDSFATSNLSMLSNFGRIIETCHQIQELEINLKTSDNPCDSLLLFLRQISKLKTLKLRLNGLSLNQFEAQEMATAISRNKHLECLDLTGCSFKENSLSVFGRIVLRICSLVSLDLSANSISDDQGASLISNMQNGSNIKNLDLSHNRLGDGSARQLRNFLESSFIGTKLQSLSVADNSISPSGLIDIVHALNNDSSLTSLDISRNFLDAIGFSLIGASLGTNTTLKRVDLSQTGIQALSSFSWKDFTSMLSLNRTIQELKLSKNPHLEEISAKCLLEALKHSHVLTTLDLKGMRLSQQAVHHIVDFLSAQNNVEVLDLSGNELGLQGILHLFGKGLSNRSRLRRLYLSDNAITDSSLHHIGAALSQEVPPRLEQLDLSWNAIGNPGVNFLTEALQRNSSLRTLNLSGNIGINDESALFLLSERISCLTSLNLSCNRMGDKGLKLMCRLLCNNDNLQEIDLSHNCLSRRSFGIIADSLQLNHSLLDFQPMDPMFEGYLFRNKVLREHWTKLSVIMMFREKSKAPQVRSCLLDWDCLKFLYQFVDFSNHLGKSEAP